MSILITGSSGYIGTELCRHFQMDETTEKIIGVDLTPPRELFGKLIFYEKDCCGDLSNIFSINSVKTIVHLVFALDPLHDSECMYRINVESMENVLSYVEKFGVERLVVTSSGTAYGAYCDNPDLLTEDMPIRGHDYQYANDKRIIEEKLAEFQSEHSEVDVVIARPAVICGPHIENFISRYITKLIVPLVKNSFSRVQLLHEEDAVRAIYTLVKEAERGAYNLGPKETLTQQELVSITGGNLLRIGPRLIRWLTDFGWVFRLKFLTEAPSSMLDFIEFSWVVDGTKIERKTSFRYMHSSKQALKEFVEAKKN